MIKILAIIILILLLFSATFNAELYENIVLEPEAFDFVVEKDPDEDFNILVLSDPQVLAEWWVNWETSPEVRLLTDTITYLIITTDPDLILITGDFTACGEEYAFIELGKYIDSLDIPWATVWGNHDHTYETYPEFSTPLDEMARLFEEEFENCLFKANDGEMGNGNFTIGIKEDGRFVEAIFMMDTHTKQTYEDENGEFIAEASLNDAQKAWYQEKVELMKRIGCNESILIGHQPLSGHNQAMRAAIGDLDSYYYLLTPDSALEGVGWKDEYRDSSFGILALGCAADSFGHIHPEDGMHELMKELDHTKYVLAGHCHENNTSILYDGIRYTHGLKTGGCAVSRWNYDFNMNGGTVITIGSSGVSDFYHKYFAYPDYFDRDQCHSSFSAPFNQ